MPELKLGRRAPKNAPALLAGRFLTAAAPSHPASEDYGQLFTGWQMLGNDRYGDCVAVTWANQRALITTALSGSTVYPSLAEVETLYKTQNPNFPSEDNGMDIQTCLEYLVSDGGPDGVKALAFAKVDYTNPDELAAAHAVFGQVWYGVNVLDANMTQFDQGQPWDYVAGSALDGGHSITGVGYKPGDWRFVTWAKETDWTDAFRSHQIEEAWVVIWPEHLGSKAFLAGVDESVLAADYYSITGREFPVQPTPGPVPAPVPPAPVPVPPVPAPVVDYEAILTKLLTAVPAGWENKPHTGDNKKAALAVQVARVAAGLPKAYPHVAEHEAR